MQIVIHPENKEEAEHLAIKWPDGTKACNGAQAVVMIGGSGRGYLADNVNMDFLLGNLFHAMLDIVRDQAIAELQKKQREDRIAVAQTVPRSLRLPAASRPDKTHA